AAGGSAPGYSRENSAIVFNRPQPFVTSLFLALSGTALCLVVAFPLAYFIASRAGKRKGLLIILLVIPFWTSFLIRTISWLVILGPRGAVGFLEGLTAAGFPGLGNPAATLL